MYSVHVMRVRRRLGERCCSMFMFVYQFLQITTFAT